MTQDCDCKDKSQCWEPCGELGHSEEHAVQRNLTQAEEEALQNSLRKSSKLIKPGNCRNTLVPPEEACAELARSLVDYLNNEVKE